MSDKKYELYRDLGRVLDDTENQIAYYRRQLESKPNGKTQAEWEAYWNKQISDAESAAHYCFIRRMQIDPD